jgi:hypothetical protein
MAISHNTTTRQTWSGAPMLDVEPFRRWLADHMDAGGLTRVTVARRVGVDEARVRRWLLGAEAGQPVVSELLVERVGIALARNPRLAAELYPQLAEPTCQVCGAARGCKHLTGERPR